MVDEKKIKDENLRVVFPPAGKPKSWDDLPEERALWIMRAANLYYEGRKSTAKGMQRLTQQDVATQMSTSSNTVHRSEVQRLLAEAEEYGIVRFVVLGSPAEHALEEQAERLRVRFGLKSVSLVPGSEMPAPADGPSRAHDAVWLSAWQRAAQEMDAHLEDGNTLCVAWGYSVHVITNYLLRPARPLPRLSVVPMLGYLSSKSGSYRFEANAHAQSAAATYGGSAFVLPAPAIVRQPGHKKIAVQLPLVRDTLERIQKADFVLSSLGSPDPASSTMVRQGLLEETEVRDLLDNQEAVGEISGLWYTATGEPVDAESIQPIGMDIAGLKRVVERGGTVMAVIAAHSDRIDPLLAALQGGIVNAVVTDSITCAELMERAR